MNYAKLIDGALRMAPRKIDKTIDGVPFVIFNPTDEQLAEAGWLPIVWTDMPDDAPEGRHYEETYSEVDDQIVQGWTLVQDPDPDDVEISAEEALALILGGNADET